MKTQFYCKKCGNEAWIDNFKDGYKTDKVYCQHCKGGVRMWKVKGDTNGRD